MTEEEQGATQFLPLKVLVEAIMAQEKEPWLEKHPESLLLLDNPGDDMENAAFQTIDVGKSKVDGGKRDQILQKLSGAGSYVFVLKREKNKFASMVTIGRAANNLMRLNVGSVSKFHAYFTHVARDKCWYLADAHSSNGTFIDGDELPPSHGKHALKNGSVLRFGPDVTAQYFEAEGFWDLLHGGQSEEEGGEERDTVSVNKAEAKQIREEIGIKKHEGPEASGGTEDPGPDSAPA